MLVGDTHGNFRTIKQAIDLAKQIGDIARIIVLGDFGLWWRHEALQYIDDINTYAKANNVQVFAIPGNHENHEWWQSIVEHGPATAHGWAYVGTHVLLSPKVHDFVWGGKQFVVAGGAVSIDRDYREEYRRQTGKRIWSPDEQLTDKQIDELLATRLGHGVPVDYLLTHDCSNRTPFHTRLKPDIQSQIHRQRIDRVIDGIKPRMHFHGHMHTRYAWENLIHADGDMRWVETYGLEADGDKWAFGVLDLDTDKFEWAADIIREREIVANAKLEPVELDDNL
jgi:Icc-related predicted phosphoesterase